MRINAHQHFWRYSADEFEWTDDSMSNLRRNFLPEDLKPEMQEDFIWWKRGVSL